eukprot:353484-Chlamydomonas_euryale.AAC.5
MELGSGEANTDDHKRLQGVGTIHQRSHPINSVLAGPHGCSHPSPHAGPHPPLPLARAAPPAGQRATGRRQSPPCACTTCGTRGCRTCGCSVHTRARLPYQARVRASGRESGFERAVAKCVQVWKPHMCEALADEAPTPNIHASPDPPPYTHTRIHQPITAMPPPAPHHKSYTPRDCKKCLLPCFAPPFPRGTISDATRPAPHPNPRAPQAMPPALPAPRRTTSNGSRPPPFSTHRKLCCTGGISSTQRESVSSMHRRASTGADTEHSSLTFFPATASFKESTNAT